MAAFRSRPKPKPEGKQGNLPGRPTATELERRKERALEVATELFVNQGYAATSLVDIARGAGVATRTLYEHFGDKEAMFREVILARNSEGAVQVPSVAQDDTLPAALGKAARYAYDVTFHKRSIGLMRLMIAESQRFPEFMRPVATSIFARFLRNIEKIFHQLEAAGLIPAGDHARSAMLFADLVLGSHPIFTYTNWAAERPGDADIDERVELFIRGRFGIPAQAGAGTSKTRVSPAA